MAPPIDPELKSLKEKRSNAKRRVTITSNLLEPRLAKGSLKDSDKLLYDKLQQEYTMFEAAYDNYAAALEEREDHDDLPDFKNLGTYLKEISDKVDAIEDKYLYAVADEKFAEDNEKYELVKAKVMIIVDKTEKESVDELKSSPGVRATLKSLEAEFPEMLRLYDILRVSVRDFIKLCKRTQKVPKTELQRHNFVADPDDITKVKEAETKLQEAVHGQNVEAEASVARERIQAQVRSSTTRPRVDAMKLEKIESVKFNGEYRSYASFVRRFKLIVVPDRAASDIGVRLQQALPEKYKNLLDNHDLEDYEGMMVTLDKKFGKHKHIVTSCINEIEVMKKPTSDELYIKMVDRLEKIEEDLKAIEVEDKLDHEEVIGKVEERLPEYVRKKWLEYLVEKELIDEKNTRGLFSIMLKFLHKYRDMADHVVGDPKSATGASKSRFCVVTESAPITSAVLMANSDVEEHGNKRKQGKKSNVPCVACGENIKHRLDKCDSWNGLNLAAKRKLIKCWKHPYATDGHTTKDCAIDFSCWTCQGQHHRLLCDKKPNSKCKSVTLNVVDSEGSPVVAASCSKSLVKTMIVKGRSDEEELGLMEDNCSTDSFVWTKKAEMMDLKGEPVVLRLEGINETKRLQTMVYEVPLRDKQGKVHLITCYGLQEIAKDADNPDMTEYEELCKRFQVDPSEVRRPSHIDVLLSSKDNFLMSDKVEKEIDGVKLYSGLLGMAFMGDIQAEKKRTYPMQAFPVKAVSVKIARMSLTDKEIIQFFKEEAIGVECQPRCGSCACGKCAIGDQVMSIKEEKAYNRFRNNMVLDKVGTEEDPGPYWRTTYPWIVPREDLVNNEPAVRGVMMSTLKKLKRDQGWRESYDKQLQDLIDRGFAAEVSRKELEDWTEHGGQIYFISHQMVIDEANLSTPIRVVFNSSQKYRGHSLNDSWELGPDMTGSMNGILQRFREDHVAAAGDIKKMYYNVRVEKVEEMMQLWLWQFAGDTEVKIFSMRSLVMGNKPSANVSQIALKETAKMDDNEKQFPDAHDALCHDSYVDNTFLTAGNTQVIQKKIDETEHVAGMAGFSYKPWVISGQDVGEVMVGQGQGSDRENAEKALGLFWNVKEDKLFVKVQISGKKRKIVLSLETLLRNPDHKLTVRDCLSLHARCFDPIGLILPLKMTGMILFRKTLQHLAAIMVVGETKLPWDKVVGGELRDKWLTYFEMLEGVKNIEFPRSVKPLDADPNIKPTIVTFSDGNEDAFGAVAYMLWTLVDGGKEARLVTSKAKLGPLLNKGEVVKNELSGAVFAARLKSWIVENSSLTFEKHHPFLDSQIVQSMVKKEDYTLNTFAGLRVKEISRKSDVSSWLHISSKQNFVADILTRGTSPDNLKEGSDWQTGPKWLIEDPSQWPVTEVTLTREEREQMKGFEKVTSVYKTVSHCVSSSSGPQCQGTAPDHGNEENVDTVHWMDAIVNKVSSLAKIVRIIAHFRRLEGRNPLKLKEKLDNVIQSGPITAMEYDDALKMLVLHEQKDLEVKKFQGFDIEDKEFELNSGQKIKLKVLKTRVKSFPSKFGDIQDDVFPLPAKSLARRIAVHYHERFHRDVDTVVAAIRQEFWVTGLRKIVSNIDKNCRSCLISRKKLACQVMGDLPSFRTTPASAFSHCSMDLFGPIYIKDSVVTHETRGSKVEKKCWGVLFSCLGARAIYLDIAEDYSTEAALHTVRRLQADKGKVQMIVSDPGTQLKGAARELQQVRQGWDEEELVRFGAKTGLEWSFTRAASPHQKGVTEIMVKLAKGVMNSMMDAIGTHVLNLNELFTLCKEVANLVNERPIGLKPNLQTDPAYLSPNSLLLGRSCDRTNAGPFQCKADFNQDPDSDVTRYLLVQAITNQFWKKWTITYFPTLLRRAKWHHAQRNLCVDDVCVLRDTNALRGEWRLCRVKKVFPDEDGKVRNVVVTVPPPSLSLMKGARYPKKIAMIDLDRHVKNLIVIVPNPSSIIS